MYLTRKAAIVFAVFALVQSLVIAQSSDLNPYDILDKHFETIGGLEKLKAEKSVYFEGDMSVGGLSGVMKLWLEKPIKTRTDLDLGILKMSQAEGEDFEWTLDQNGNLQQVTNFDQATLDRKNVKKLIADYAYLNPNLKTFTVGYKGTIEPEEEEYFVIEITNSINVDKLTYYINSKSYLLGKSVSLEGHESSDIYYDDYRDIDGLKVAFYQKQVHHQTGQAYELKITKYESNPDIDLSVFQPPVEELKDYRFTKGFSSEDIPFRFVENHLYIPVIVNCQERWWVLDTGASITVVDKSYAKELELTLEGEMKGAGAGGQIDVNFAKLPAYKLKGIEFDPQTVAVVDLSELNSLLPIEISGILGFDFFSRFVTRIDYANELVTFFEPDKFQYDGNGKEIGFHLKNNHFMVEATLDGKYSGTWLFDLGAGGIHLHDVYAHWKGLDKRKGIEGLGHGAGNYYRSREVQFDKFEFAGFETDKPHVNFATGVTDTMFTADEIGTLGNSLFRNFVIYCDYSNERLIIEKGENFNKNHNRDRSGVRIKKNGNNDYEIIFVPDNTPASKAKLEVGDILRKINGIDVSHFDGIAAIRSMMAEAPGTKYEILIERNNKEKKLKFKLKDLHN